jgi:hypothetical protein
MNKKRRQYIEAKRTSDNPDLIGPFPGSSTRLSRDGDAYAAGTQTRSGSAQARAEAVRGGKKQTGTSPPLRQCCAGPEGCVGPEGCLGGWVRPAFVRRCGRCPPATAPLLGDFSLLAGCALRSPLPIAESR